ncbi:MAG: YjgP/YjgQ family permease [Bacteroidetes bacterium]|jgi:lipopolysaccharide export system permease protein|nr:YjgP/YjgQ family permease [Bacteroidota bacterium]MBT5529152.1 YjgP/YjgQ family permease [Cytophagia bacterium]MBT3421174.1 YjgP/YjgQ family permease [Bacteroidota bacterium]MBT3802285.1 YjgP/YjgQ family permease [Bacteroidota bacterium]MBT3933391.1 YjgP/YjgQ family permease [Bacteroidota bacterium]
MGKYVSIIDKYIIRKFLSTFVFILALFIMISVVFDFSEKIDDFLNRNAPLNEIVFDYYLNFIPYFMNLFSPLFIFISAVYFTSRMAYNTEIVAMLSAGVNFYRLLKPYFLVALLLAAFSWYLTGWVIPTGNEKLIEFESKYIKDPVIRGNSYLHRQIAPDVFIYIRNYNRKENSGSRFTLEKFDETKLKFKIMALKIQWVDSTEKWKLTNYTIRKIEGLKETLVKGDDLQLKLPMHPRNFGRKTENIQSMDNRELSQFIKAEQLRGEDLVTFYVVEKAKRTSMPAATFILVLIAFSISSRRIRGGIGLHLGIGIMIAFSYILFMQFSTIFAINGNLNPILACWIPNILYAILGIVLVIKAPK